MNELSPGALRHCLHSAETITFSTTNPNGTIHSVPVWYRYDGEAFWVATGAGQRKTRNLRRDPRVSLLLLVEQTAERPTEIALVYGTATVHDWSPERLAEKALWIFEKYVDEDEARSYLEPGPGAVTCMVEISASRIVAWHP